MMPPARVAHPKLKQGNKTDHKKAAPSKRKGVPKPCSSAELISLFNEVINAGNCTYLHMFTAAFPNGPLWNLGVLKSESKDSEGKRHYDTKKKVTEYRIKLNTMSHLRTAPSNIKPNIKIICATLKIASMWHITFDSYKSHMA
jgi:hypothetical protein